MPLVGIGTGEIIAANDQGLRSLYAGSHRVPTGMALSSN